MLSLNFMVNSPLSAPGVPMVSCLGLRPADSGFIAIRRIDKSLRGRPLCSRANSLSLTGSAKGAAISSGGQNIFGSARQSGQTRILRGFPESDEFGLGGCQALCLQQQIVHVTI